MTDREVAEVLAMHVKKYKDENPFRTADCHPAKCLCQRCFVDFASAAVRRLMKETP